MIVMIACRRALLGALTTATLAAAALSASALIMHTESQPDDPRLSRVDNARARAVKKLAPVLAQRDLHLGSPLFIRVFKESREMEVFLKHRRSGRYKLLKTYRICSFSGGLGPKLKRGDRQAPEGFYFVPPAAMNPNSRFHLSFNLGYPNQFDRTHGRTGDYLMVHGSCVSAGCYAMTDPVMEEIYTLADAALAGGQEFFRVHCFPFRMTGARMELAARRGSQWLPFWRNLKRGYDLFERDRIPPDATVADGRYRLHSRGLEVAARTPADPRGTDPG